MKENTFYLRSIMNARLFDTKSRDRTAACPKSQTNFWIMKQKNKTGKD